MRINVPVLTTFVVAHALAAVAWFCFSWSAFIMTIVMVVATTILGIGLGYHRLMSHAAFRCPPWLAKILVTIGALSVQGEPDYWAGFHRVHHSKVDGPEDQSSPYLTKGVVRQFLYSHIGWMFIGDDFKPYKTHAPQRVREGRYFALLNRRWFYLVMQVIQAALFTLLGLAIGGWRGAASMFLWAFAFRIVFVWHCTWLVNSATHMWGSRPYEDQLPKDTLDRSGNLWWVALLTGGEGWHHNHHIKPRAANFGNTRWSFDPGWWIIWTLSKFGLAWDLQTREYLSKE